MWGRAAKGATGSLREQEECWLLNGVTQLLLGFIKHNFRSGIKGSVNLYCQISVFAFCQCSPSWAQVWVQVLLPWGVRKIGIKALLTRLTLSSGWGKHFTHQTFQQEYFQYFQKHVESKLIKVNKPFSTGTAPQNAQLFLHLFKPTSSQFFVTDSRFLSPYLTVQAFNKYVK